MQNDSINDETPEIEEEIPSIPYRIDTSWYERQGRSLRFMLQERMCDDSRERAKLQTAISAAPATEGRRSSRKSGLVSVEDYIEEIRECCSNEPGFKRGGTLGEVLFRILLAGGNKPRTSLELCESMQEWVGGNDGRAMTPSVVERLLATDAFYGFAPAN